MANESPEEGGTGALLRGAGHPEGDPALSPRVVRQRRQAPKTTGPNEHPETMPAQRPCHLIRRSRCPTEAELGKTRLQTGGDGQILGKQQAALA